MNRLAPLQSSSPPLRASSADPDAFDAAAAELQRPRPLRNARLRRLASSFLRDDPERLESELRGYLAGHPDDADAFALRGQAAVRLGRQNEARLHFARCLELAPDLVSVRFRYAKLLVRLREFPAALEQFERLLDGASGNPLLRSLKATILEVIGRNEEALAIHERLAGEYPARPQSWTEYGASLRANGFRDKSIAAYRKALEIDPSAGPAWWGLANLKTYRFGDADIAAMDTQLKRPELAAGDRADLELSLGKACEDRREYERSWKHYARGNAALRLRSEDDPISATGRVGAHKALFTREFFASRAGWGCPAPDPIFVVGRMRSGSTLVEQILSSHPAIEGIGELPYIAAAVNRLRESAGSTGGTEYPSALDGLAPAALKALGGEYIEKTRLHRKSARPFFVDKSPPNFFHLGLIQLILPNAKIVDARRNPAACCLSIFKQGFHELNLRLSELGRVYRDYVELMAHFDRILPGKVHRVIYEDMVADPQTEIRKLLDYLGLPFEESCLRFHETERAILTPSSEQVRRPIAKDAVDHWRNFEPWLGPLKQSLGSVLTEYPSIPEELR